MRKIILLVFCFYAFLWAGILLKNNFIRASGEVATTLQEIENKTDAPAKFLEFHRGIRARDSEASPQYETGYKWKELREARRQSWGQKRNVSARTKFNGVLAYVERGPGNVPGRTRALLNIAGDPNNNTWLAGAATGGIWRSSDGGSSWTEKSQDFPALPISSFAANTDCSVIYASSGEFISSVFSAIGNGIFKSIDKGQTWIQLPSTNNNSDFSIVTRLIVNPSNGNMIVASTVPHNLAVNKTSSIMRSVDGGLSWVKVKDIAGILEQVLFTPGDFNIQYASQNGVGVWKSIDAGLTWNLSNQGMAPNGRIEIAVSPVNTKLVFASADGTLSGSQSDLYYSENAGASWSLINIMFSDKVVDFLEGQGFYDNTIVCDPFNANIVYFGGVSLFRTTLGSGSSIVDNWKILENGTASFIFLQSFQNIEWDKKRLTVDPAHPKITVQLRFGTGLSQKAHRFFVPVGATSGVPATSYTYVDYVTVPFEAWDITTPASPRQLMVSFRDQNRNGFDLLPSKLQDTNPPNEHSREYLYIHTLNYHPTVPSANIAVVGGHEKNLAYNIFPSLAVGATWPASITTSNIEIKYTGISKINATTITVADGRGTFDNKNKSNQINLGEGVHPDHHCMVPIIMDQAARTYKILLGNDGGVFVSKVTTTPGTVEGDWIFKGYGYNTGQFYGADKRPGKDQYIGGLQDNGTRISPATQPASAKSSYDYALGGDGFEVLWNNKDDNKILGSVYYGQLSRTTNGGTSWQTSTNGLNPGAVDFPFVTKLANSKDFPDRVFTVGGKGVYTSQDFGLTWKLTPIPDKFILASSFFLDVEVSRANANIVWAGSGMTSTGPLSRFLHVSKNGGQTFSPAKNYTTVELGNITKLASHPTQELTAYALFSFSKGPKILRTTNLGESWEDISGFGNGSTSLNGFPDVAVFCLYVRPDNPDILWAGTEIGIVESTNNGATWALITDFPNVSVWDMKGQDNQVVIATHGRGIWTANLEADQVTGKTPVIIASGTSPLGNLVLRVQAAEAFDSIQFFTDATLTKTIFNLSTGFTDFQLSNIAPGEKNIKMIGYKGKVPYQSGNYKANHVAVLPPKKNYSTYFLDLNDVQVNGLSLQNFSSAPNQRKSLQTNHNYSVNKIYELFIRTPVIVSGTIPVLFYRDIGIIEPTNDSIIVEATKNGIDWIPLAQGYDATFSGDETGAWNKAFLNTRPGNGDMFIKHEVNFGNKFVAEDLILFRFRLISGFSITSWGWALDYISIQEQPLGPEPQPLPKSQLNIFPNPSKGQLTVNYTLTKSSEISFRIIDVYGRFAQNILTGYRKAGYNSEELNLQTLESGTYIITLNSEDGKKDSKLIIAR